VDELQGAAVVEAGVAKKVVSDEVVVSGAVDELPAVVVIPGVDRITIASEDQGALDQLESIVRATFSRAGSQRGRDFSVYQLRNAGAEDVAQTLRSIYTSPAGLLAFGSVVIVPEPRLNALIVYGTRLDRERIEQLLEILDTEKLPDSGRVFRTEVVEVRHADAEDIEDVIEGVYRTELSAGGSRRAIEIPAGIDSSVASVLRQINAQSSAPLLTVEAQRETNSLILKAPQNLIDEITELVRQLDDSSRESRARSVRLVPLQRTNSRRVMEVLDEVLGR
jgi:type II secretory pathway component GspD/PulD (secretin)